MTKYNRAVAKWNKAAQQWAANKDHPLKRRYYRNQMKQAAKQIAQARVTQ